MFLKLKNNNLKLILKEHNAYMKILNQNAQHQDIFQQDLGHKKTHKNTLFQLAKKSM